MTAVRVTLPMHTWECAECRLGGGDLTQSIEKAEQEADQHNAAWHPTVEEEDG